MSKKVQKIILILSCEILFLLFILIILPSVLIRERPGYIQTTYENTLPLDINHQYLQKISSDKKNLRSISVQLKNPGLIYKDKIKIEVLDSKNNTLKSLETSGISVGDPSWVNFEFDPIKSNRNEIFYIKVSTPNKKDNEIYIYGNDSTKQINYKSYYKDLSTKESFNSTIKFQTEQIKNREAFALVFYSLLVVLLNIFIFTIL